MIKENKQVKFGEHIFGTTEKNPIKIEECTLRLHPNRPIKRKQRASPSQRFTVFESFAKTSLVLFRENNLQQHENTARKFTPIVSSRIFYPAVAHIISYQKKFSADFYSHRLAQTKIETFRPDIRGM